MYHSFPVKSRNGRKKTALDENKRRVYNFGRKRVISVGKK